MRNNVLKPEGVTTRARRDPKAEPWVDHGGITINPQPEGRLRDDHVGVQVGIRVLA